MAKRKRRRIVLDPLMAQAQQYAAAQIDPLRSMIEAQQQRYQQETQNQSAALLKAAQLISQQLQPISGQINQIYGDAAQRQSVFGKGYSDAFRQIEGQAAAEGNKTLQNIGAPQGQMLQGDQGGADVLYGLGGSLPAQTFNREGAAYASAAAFLPQGALTQGAIQNLTYLKSRQAGSQDLLDQLSKLEAQYPGLVHSAYNDLFSNRLNAQKVNLANRIAVQELGLKKQNQAFSQAATKARINQGAARIKLSATQADRNYDLALKRLGIQDERLRLSIRQADQKAVEKRKSGGLKSSDLARIKKDANLYYYGIQPTTRADGSISRQGVSAISYQRALARLMATYGPAGLTVRQAIKILNSFYKPGEDGRPVGSIRVPPLGRFGVQASVPRRRG